MVVVRFVLPASVPIAPVKQLAWEAAACSPYVQLDKPISVLVEDHFDFTFLTRFTIKAYVHEIRLERVLASDISERCQNRPAGSGESNLNPEIPQRSRPSPLRCNILFRAPRAAIFINLR